MKKFPYSGQTNHRPKHVQAIRLIATFGALIFICEYLIQLVGWLTPHFESYIRSVVQNEFLGKGIVIFLTAYLSLIIFNSSFILFEIGNIQRSSLTRRYLRGFLFQSISLPIIIVVSYPVFMLRKWIGVEALVSADSMGTLVMIYPMVVLLAYDLTGYWVHRAFHKYDFLWRFHSVHHEIRDLNTWNSYSHFGELFIVTVFNTLTISILLEDPAIGIAFVTAFFARNGNFVHSDSPTLSVPTAFRHIFVDNLYHHHHHASDRRYYNTNFAAHFSFIDRIFGTQTFPEGDEFPKTGIHGYRPIESVRDYIFRPFDRKAVFDPLFYERPDESVIKP